MKSQILRNKQNGFALITALIILVFLLPISMVLLKSATEYLVNATKERQIFTARTLADNVITDIMREFSQSYYINRYAADYTVRAEAFYKLGFSEVAVTPDAVNHSMYIRALGQYGKDASIPMFQRTLNTVLKFISPWTDFGTMLNQAFTTSANNATYTGKMWINGNYDITGNLVRFMGGPVFVAGNFTTDRTGTNRPVVNGDVYYSGTISNNIIVNGTKYNFLPALNFPVIDTSYYETHWNQRYNTADVTLVFNAIGTYTQGANTVTLPTTGYIIFVQGRNVTVRGTVRGRVTIICTRVGGVGGTITINNNLVYANGTNQASALDSLALLTNYGITIDKRILDMTVCGVLQSAGADNYTLTRLPTAVAAGNGGTVRLFGSRNKGITIPGGAFTTNPAVTITYDNNLNSFPPPGLPEKPIVVTYHWRK